MNEDYTTFDEWFNSCSDAEIKQYLDECEADRILASGEYMEAYYL